MKGQGERNGLLIDGSKEEPLVGVTPARHLVQRHDRLDAGRHGGRCRRCDGLWLRRQQQPEGGEAARASNSGADGGGERAAVAAHRMGGREERATVERGRDRESGVAGEIGEGLGLGKAAVQLIYSRSGASMSVRKNILFKLTDPLVGEASL